jgi:hypothetical protein
VGVGWSGGMFFYRLGRSARMPAAAEAMSTHVCEVPSDGMDPTTRAAGVRPEVVCVQKHDLQARARVWPKGIQTHFF